ncbi:hypothetical protein MHYP_G00312050 [Metynnis hypsauchen]
MQEDNGSSQRLRQSLVSQGTRKRGKKSLQGFVPNVHSAQKSGREKVLVKKQKRRAAQRSYDEVDTGEDSLRGTVD